MLNINEEVKETIKVISELFFSGNYEEAENLTDILNRLMEMLGNTNPFFLQFLNIQGRLLENKGDYQAAIEKYLIAISEYQRENNTNSLEYSRVIDNLGVTYLRIGDFSSAKPLLEESLKIRENTSEKDYIDIVTSFSNLGSYYLIIGELKEALKFYFRSLNILQNQCENKVFEATIMNNIGELYGQIYNDELAELYHYQALGIRRSILGEDTLDYAQSLVNLAQTFSVKENKKPLAKIFFEEAIRIYEKINSLKKTPHPDFFIIQSSYCSLLNDLGLIIEAENSLKKLLQTNVIALGKNNVFIGNIQLALAKNYAFQNKFYESSLLFSKGISNLEKYYKYNPNLVEPYLFLSLLFAKTGKWIDSYNTLTKAITIRDRITKNLVGFASEKQQLKYLSMIKQEISIIFFLIRCQSVNQSDFIALGMNYILRYKGISADMAAIKKECISVQDNSDIIAKYNKYLSLKKAVLNLQIGDSSFSDKFENEKLLKNLEIDLEILESELSEFIPDVGKLKKWMVLSQNVIIPFLPISSVIIEYVHYKELDLDQTLKIGTFVQKSPNYAAFIIKSDNRIIFYDLGDAKEIYDIITSLPNEIEKDSYSFIASKKIGDNLNSMLKDLRKKLIDPLMEELTNIYHVIISPDYYLNYLPFGILIEDNDSFLIENFLISYLSSSRDILQFCDCNNEESNPPLVFASPDFNYLYPEQVDSIGEESEKYWGELEYAKNEGRIVGSKLNINEITGHTVNEDLIINCQSPIILHICSHGFFFDNLEELPQRLQSIAINSNPLLHSRFVVSGANAWIHGIVTPPEIGKGHIFAEEITGLNLNHTQMVVLSLCKSGKGELMSGEGVFGLRRSFVISGAKTLIMSLFDIDDMWTVTLINDFYDYLLSGKGKAESLIRTQINLMKQINHPYYWGGFICQGDFKQLQ